MSRFVKTILIAFVAAIALANVVDAKLTVSTLSAISADLGTVTTGTLNGVVINGGTINGGVIDIGSGQFTVSNAGILYLGGPTTVDATLTVDNLEVTPMSGGGVRYVCTTDAGFLFAAASC